MKGIQFIGWEGNWSNITEDRAIRAWGTEIEETTATEVFAPDVMVTPELDPSTIVTPTTEVFPEM